MNFEDFSKRYKHNDRIDFLNILTQLTNILYEYYPLLKEKKKVIEEVLFCNEEIERQLADKSLYNSINFNKNLTYLKSSLREIDQTIFKPLEKKLLMLDIIRYNTKNILVENDLEEESDDQCEILAYIDDIKKNKFFLYELDMNPLYNRMLSSVFLFTTPADLSDEERDTLKDIKGQVEKYITFRDSIILSSHKFSRILLCFDELMKRCIYNFNMDNNLSQQIHKPQIVYRQSIYPLDGDYFEISEFISHVLPPVEIEYRIKNLISTFDEMIEDYEIFKGDHKFSSKPEDYIDTGVSILEDDLDDYLLKQIKGNRPYFDSEEYDYFLDDILDLLDTIKPKLFSRKQKRYLNSFFKKIDNLRMINNTNNFKNDLEVFDNEKLSKTYWFYVGIKLLSGQIDELYNEHKNFNEVAKQISNSDFKSGSLRPYISESFNNTSKSNKNIQSRKDINRIFDFMKKNGVKISPKYQYLDVN